MCLKNPFFGRKSKQTVMQLTTCQSAIMENLATLAQGEVHHMDTVARLYMSQNGATPDFDRILLRDSDFIGGKRVHTVEAWP